MPPRPLPPSLAGNDDRRKPGQKVGNWRDSELGLGNGRYPYVNAVFVPAALAAIGHIADNGLLTPHINFRNGQDLCGRDRLGQGLAQLQAVLRRSPRSSRRPRRDRGIRRQRRRTPPRHWPRLGTSRCAFTLWHSTPGARRSRSNSDAGFALLFLDLPPDTAVQIGTSVARQFPAGLLPGVGLVVANPAFATTDLDLLSTRSRYHGTVSGRGSKLCSWWASPANSSAPICPWKAGAGPRRQAGRRRRNRPELTPTQTETFHVRPRTRDDAPVRPPAAVDGKAKGRSARSSASMQVRIRKPRAGGSA